MAASDKRSSGQQFRPPTAQMWNAMVDAGESHQARELGAANKPLPGTRKTDILKVKNGTGAQRSRGEVLGNFTKSITTLEAEKLQLSGAAPTSGKAFAVLLKTAASGAIVDGQVSGVCLATVNVGSTSHEYADIDPPNHKLVSAETGPVRIVWQPGSTGDQECVVLLGASSSGSTIGKYLGTLAAPLTTDDATASVTLTQAIRGDLPADTSIEASNAMDWSGQTGNIVMVEDADTASGYVLDNINCSVAS